ncbi:MAG: esterase-like activity of phytase family protein [Alphaproteobacteria bacterium]|jgi:hypothetical protein|nr:esterase-like activity of phytase family protein [Alphaproteobacteria bacterium]
MAKHGCVRALAAIPRWLAAAITPALVAAVLAGAAGAAEVTVRLEPVPLNVNDPAQERVGALRFIAGYILRSDDLAFGGLSGLTLSLDGRRFVAVSDLGRWLTGKLLLAADGRLEGLAEVSMSPLPDTDGRPVNADAGMHDAEAVERQGDGGYLVSFERRHRLWRYPPPAGLAGDRAKRFLRPDDFDRLPVNGGIEALAVLADGGVLMLSEAFYVGNGDLQGWLWRRGRTRPLRYATSWAFKPTDIARLPNGDLLVLERRYSLLGGAGARLRRLAKADIKAGARLKGQEIARLEWPLTVDNFEGLAVAPAPGGGTLVYLLSDNNFSPLQDTLLLQFRLAE